MCSGPYPEMRQVLRGAVDLHLHTAPDVFERRLDDLEAARQAQEAGIRAICLKNHFFPTMGRAVLTEASTGLRTLGSITLNRSVGGLNPEAVELALKVGARIVWMPTLQASSAADQPGKVKLFADLGPGRGEGLSLVEKGRLRPEVHEILEVMAGGEAVLATGHLPPPEAGALVRAAVQAGLERIVLTHPFSCLVEMELGLAQELLGLSQGVFLEMACHDCYPHNERPLSYQQVAELIKQVGPERVIITSDGGQTYNPPPVNMLLEMAAQLAGHFARPKLEAMFAHNPAALAGL